MDKITVNKRGAQKPGLCVFMDFESPQHDGSLRRGILLGKIQQRHKRMGGQSVRGRGERWSLVGPDGLKCKGVGFYARTMIWKQPSRMRYM